MNARKAMAQWLIIVGLGLLVYAQTFSFGFAFDDHEFIVNNPYIKNLSNLPQMWLHFPRTRMGGMYSFALNYQLNALNPAGYHIFNVLVHFLATGLVWALASVLFKTVGRSAGSWPLVIALFFLVHPCQTQAVTYVSQRFESMAALFYLAAVYCYVRGRLSALPRAKIFLFLSAVACGTFGIMTKETAATLPAMVLAVEWIIFSRQSIHQKEAGPKRSVGTYIAVLAGGLVFIFVFMKLVRSGLGLFLATFSSESHDGDILTPGNYFWTQMRVFLTFMRLLVFPINQNLEYDYPMSTGIFSPPLTLAGVLLIAVMAFAVVRLRRQQPLIAFGVAWMLVTFSINMAPRSNVIYEHKLYLISFGFFVALIAAMAGMCPEKAWLKRVLACVIIALTAVSFTRNRVWQNELTLWEDIARKSPHKARVNANLGRVYGTLGRDEESIRFLSKAIDLNPKDDISYADRGVMLARQGRWQEALRDYDKALKINPEYVGAYIKRAWVYQQQHDHEAALKDLGTAIRGNPIYSDSFLARGMLFVEMGRASEALSDFNQALHLAPYDGLALLNRGVLYFHNGQFGSALDDFSKALTIQPSALLYKNRAYTYLNLGKPAQALADFQECARLDPADPDAAGQVARFKR